MVTVPACEDMDDETFALHMSKRHAGSLGGLPFLELAGKSPGLVAAWRAFHRRLHMLAMPGQIDDHCHIYHAEAVTSR